MNSSTHQNLQAPLVNANNQSQDGPSTSVHPVGQAQHHEMIVAKSSGEYELPKHNEKSHSHVKEFTREDLISKMDELSTKIEGYLQNKTNKDKGKQKVPSNKYQRRVSNNHQRRILDEVLQLEQCPVKGYVYGLVDEENNPVTGASDSLRAWWKDQVMFEKVGPTQIEQYYKDNSISSNMAQNNNGKSTIELLMELSDTTIGSIMSLLVQHCDPPQKNFVYEMKPIPPWWPTGREDWWDQIGIPKNEGPPPFKKPHNLKKKWKAIVVVGIIKLMSPNFSKPYNLVNQSRYLSSHMNAKEKKFWTLALVAGATLYSQEHLDVLDEVVAFLHAYGSMSSKVPPSIVALGSSSNQDNTNKH